MTKEGQKVPVGQISFDRFSCVRRFPALVQPLKTGAPKNDFREPHQADLACPALA
jgi:hypothetical protein